MKKNLFAVGVASFLAAAASFSSADTVKLDPIHSMVVFRIKHMGASSPYGVFHAVSGSVTADGDGTPTLDISVPVEKIDMGTEAWEKHIKSADFFNAKQFPNITFKSTAAKKTADDTWEVTGDLTLHGVTKSITVTLSKTGEGNIQGKTAVGYDCTFKIKRSDFGVNFMVGPVGDDVTLMVNLEGEKQ